MMSTWEASDISNGVTKVQDKVIAAAAAANVSPTLVGAKVKVECDNSPPASPTFSFGACSPGTAPANVRVRITDFTVNLGEWFPFIGQDGLLSFSGITLAPHTTMRYMN